MIGFQLHWLHASGTIGDYSADVPLVIYGVATNTSIGDLFLAGLFPGILMGIGLSITAYGMSKKRGYVGTGKHVGLKELLKIIWDSKLALFAYYRFRRYLCGYIYSHGSFRCVSSIFVNCGDVCLQRIDLHGYGAILILCNQRGDNVFNWFFNYFRHLSKFSANTAKIAAAMISVTDNVIVMLLLINIFLLIVGMLIDNIPAVLILAPIFLPILKASASRRYICIIMTMNLAIGFVTPPYGINLFVATAISDVSMERLTKCVLPFILTLIAVLMVVTYVPGLSMALHQIGAEALQNNL